MDVFYKNDAKSQNKLVRAQRDANIFTKNKIEEIMVAALDALEENEIEVTDKAKEALTKVIGTQIAVAYGVGYITGVEKKRLYNASGGDLV